MNATKFNMTRDINGYNGFGLDFALNGYQGVLAATVEQHVTVPSSYPHWIAVFSYSPGAAIWVNGITTATAASGAFSATTSELNPAARAVDAGDTISFITNDTNSPEVGVTFYVAPPFGN